MDVLLVKMSSLGDIVHVLPAVADAARAGARIDWVVEEDYQPLAARAAGVAAVLPVALRRWRAAPGRHWREFQAFRRSLRRRRYDLALDAQGLLKSAAVARCARARHYAGFDAASVRERPAALAYGRRLRVPKGMHAIDRCRRLFAAAIGYDLPRAAPCFGLNAPAERDDTLVLAHGASWPTKLWPQECWIDLARRAVAAGLTPALPWTDGERQRALRIQAAVPAARLWPRTDIGGALRLLARARGVIGVDSGLVHLGAALGRPTVAMFGATDVALTGCRGHLARNLATAAPCAPCRSRRCRRPDAALWRDAPACLAAVSPERVWSAFAALLRQDDAGPALHRAATTP